MVNINVKSFENGVMTIGISGKIDSGNAAEYEEALFSLIKEKGAENAVLDAGQLEYISSAGLRVILKLKKSLKEFKVINVSLEVYDIFDMTGFTDIIDIEKALRKISLEGCEVLGKGGHGEVYQIDKETIVKVYIDGSDMKKITEEMNCAKKAFVSGVPTAISYDVVDCGEGRLGVVYEMMNGTLSKYMLDNPDKFDECAKKYAELLKTLHTAEADSEFYGKFHTNYIRLAEKLRGDIGDEKTDKLIEFINAVPYSEMLIHGDCHPNNIMIHNGELLLIDMGDISCGNPIFEWAALHQDMMTIGEERCVYTIGLPFSTAQKLFTKTLCFYLGTDNEEKIEGFIKMCQPFNLLRMILMMANGSQNAQKVKYVVYEIADKQLFPNIDTFISIAKNLPITFI